MWYSTVLLCSVSCCNTSLEPMTAPVTSSRHHSPWQHCLALYVHYGFVHSLASFLSISCTELLCPRTCLVPVNVPLPLFNMNNHYLAGRAHREAQLLMGVAIPCFFSSCLHFFPSCYQPQFLPVQQKISVGLHLLRPCPLFIFWHIAGFGLHCHGHGLHCAPMLDTDT